VLLESGGSNDERSAQPATSRSALRAAKDLSGGMAAGRNHHSEPHRKAKFQSYIGHRVPAVALAGKP
jgi:hypothetical protein